ncbi:3'(2'),5'-bisphosphate nucleotidase CysQ [Helicobacter sp. 16-1353]|uniref:3'(2'),5'-bisphosphate nucleotidase CysQ family protein n=1 Tax=Helicobacter sp. 16-1353 TaxID=2004996 RepID=UPI000DCC7623|nr:3'(2'),5'-bisphosphate nucleotidase CysQ [Helicobacter sp. 16-1353]RAX51919.1 3'(2'),5'-bisphosphate nucleotidase CysQ [Helicobacter sp. 16-1353]
MNEILLKVINTILRAGEVTLKHYGEIDFILKDDNSPLTKADIESNNIIIGGLKDISSFQINSEESPLDYSIRKNLEYLWLVDPLDGTKDFLAKNNQWTINIALLKNNIPILGVVYAPAINEMYFAYKDNGAYFIDLSKTKDFKKAKKLNKDSKNLIALDSNFHSTKETQEFFNKYHLKVVKLGSSLKLCAIANAKASIYPRFNGTKEWDTAAGDIILRESGGIIIDKLTKKQLLYNKENIKNNHFIAFGKTQINQKIYKDFMEANTDSSDK